MSLLWNSLTLVGLALVAHYFWDMTTTKFPLHFDGHVDNGYEDIQKAFEQNFIDGWESEGASLAVFVRGRKVVDIWGGYADKQAARIWKKDTITVTFSTTKAVAAVCIALLVDRGYLKYEDPIAKHWLAFSKNGKGNITVEWVLSHMAGLPYLDTPITEEVATNHNMMRQVLENEAPKVPPGLSSGYHAFTYGWLVDQIVRHVDKKHRGIGQFFREEIAEPHGIDYHIGLNRSEEYRVARVTLPRTTEILRETWHDSRAFTQLFYFLLSEKTSPLAKAVANPSWLDIMDRCTVNNPEQHAMEQAAVLGIGNARSLATIFSLFVNGNIVGHKTLEILNTPIRNETDYVLNVPTVKGHGFFYSRTPEKESLSIGHSGHGCQQVIFVPDTKVAFAYITNGLKAGVFDNCRNYVRLQKAIFETTARHL